MILLIFIYGLLIGSFINVCIYRIPRKESIVFPSSHCIYCGTKLKWYDLVPIISYIILKGKCRYCGKRISLLYPFVEFLHALIYIMLYLKFGLSLDLIYYAIIFSLLIIIFFIDLYYMVIPDILVFMILVATIVYKFLLFLIFEKNLNLINSFLGLLVSGLLFILIIFMSKGGMGDGDVILISSLGFILGIKKILLTILLSFIIGAIFSIFMLISNIKGMKDPIPFGPFIILGFIISLIWGEQIINWYINMFLT